MVRGAGHKVFSCKIPSVENLYWSTETFILYRGHLIELKEVSRPVHTRVLANTGTRALEAPSRPTSKHI